MIPFVILTIEDPDDRFFMESLYITYNRLIYSEIGKIVNNRWDIEDTQQAVLVKLIDKIPLLKSFDRSQLVNYIIVTSRNTALNFVRDQKRATGFSFDEGIDSLGESYPSETSELDHLLLKERLEDVAQAWQVLDPRSRRLLELKYILDRPNEEIAREFGVGTNSVRMLLTRARDKLKRNLKTTAE